MRTTRVTFEEVSITGTKSGICPRCGKKVSRHKKFYQTLNPFNLGPGGLPKSRSEIAVELTVEREKWWAEQVYHQKCEGE